MRSDIPFGSLLVYSPYGTTPGSVLSRRACDQIKRSDPRALNRIADLIPKHPVIAQMFGADVVLVPTPGSAPLHKGALWTPERLCQAMLARGLGAQVLPCVSRAKAVKKSAFAAPADRPRAREHYASMAADGQPVLDPPSRVVVVDDVVTRGATLIAACSLVAEVFPDADVRGFAAVRTMTGHEIEDLVQPVVGEITIFQPTGETYRSP